MISCSVIFVQTSSRLERTNPALGREDDEKYPRSKKWMTFFRRKITLWRALKQMGTAGPAQILSTIAGVFVYMLRLISVYSYTSSSPEIYPP